MIQQTAVIVKTERQALGLANAVLNQNAPEPAAAEPADDAVIKPDPAQDEPMPPVHDVHDMPEQDDVVEEQDQLPAADEQPDATMHGEDEQAADDLAAQPAAVPEDYLDGL
jgi:hypothetical protein